MNQVKDKKLSYELLILLYSLIVIMIHHIIIIYIYKSHGFELSAGVW